MSVVNLFHVLFLIRAKWSEMAQRGDGKSRAYLQIETHSDLGYHYSVKRLIVRP